MSPWSYDFKLRVYVILLQLPSHFFSHFTSRISKKKKQKNIYIVCLSCEYVNESCRIILHRRLIFSFTHMENEPLLSKMCRVYYVPYLLVWNLEAGILKSEKERSATSRKSNQL